MIERLLAEALTLTALMGATLKDTGGQLTIQTRSDSGVIRLLVCDYRGGELRGYIQYDEDRWPNCPPTPRCSRCSARAIWRSPSTWR